MDRRSLSPAFRASLLITVLDVSALSAANPTKPRDDVTAGKAGLWSLRLSREQR